MSDVYLDPNGVEIIVGARVSTGGDSRGMVTALEDNTDADYQDERFVQCGWPEVYVLGDDEATPERFTCHTDRDGRFHCDDVEVVA